MKLLRLLLVCVFPAAAAVAQSSDITVNGTTYKKARIVSISDQTATIVHEGGKATVMTSDVDLEVLARAQMTLSEAAAKKKKADSDQAKKDEVDLRKAQAAAYEAAQKKKGKAPSATTPRDLTAEVANLKALFPAKQGGNARVFIPKSGQNKKPYIVSSTVVQGAGGTTSINSTRHNAGEGRIDTIQYDAPSDDMWRWYRGMFSTTTVEAFPRTLDLVEARIAEDTAKLQRSIGGSSLSAEAQAQHTLQWFDKSLRPYIAKWRALQR